MKEYAKSHPVWLCDIWGVVHNGVAPFKPAVDALIAHRNQGGIVILISNSPRPKPQLIEQLDMLTIGPEAYDGIVSSGDVTRALVEERLDQKVFHLGPERDKGIFKDIECEFADARRADYIVCSGLMDDTVETPENYRDLLQACARQSLIMVCANPDLKVQRGTDLIYCAGALAGLYEELGGEVIYAGKPYLPIYERAVEAAGVHNEAVIEKSQILAIGDGAHTDAAGAAAFGCDFVFITGGLMSAENGGSSGLAEQEAENISRQLYEKAPNLRLKGIAPILA